MAIGNPLLAAWDTDDNLRTFEYSGGVFISIGVLGGIAHVPTGGNVAAGAPAAPALAWDYEDGFVIVSRVSSVGTRQAESYTAPLTLVANTAILTGSSAFSDGGSRYNRVKHRLQARGFGSISSYPSVLVSAAGALSGANPATTTGELCADLAFTADGIYSFAALAVSAPDGTPLLVFKQTSDAPAFSAVPAPSINIRPHIVKTCPNNRGVVIFDKTSKIGKVYTFLAETLEFLHDLTLPTGTPVAAEFSPDGLRLAVGIDTGSGYVTRLFDRKGDYFAVDQDLSGIGKLLSFSGDSALLVDAALKKAWTLTDSAVTDVSATAMVNIPDFIAAQAMSEGRSSAIGEPYVYDAAIAGAANNSINWNSLKLTLLTSAASFDRTDPDMDSVTNLGAWEVTTGDWPAGGILLENVTRTAGAGGIFDVTADEIRHLVLFSAIFARYGVIYDSVTDIPLVNIDFVSERDIATGREAVFTFVDGAFFRYQN